MEVYIVEKNRDYNLISTDKPMLDRIDQMWKVSVQLQDGRVNEYYSSVY